MMKKDATITLRVTAELRDYLVAQAEKETRSLGAQVLHYIKLGMDEPKTKAVRSTGLQKPEGITDQVWADFVKLRASKKAPITQSAIDGIAAQAAQVKWTLDAALRECCTRGWTGFKAEWVRTQGGKQNALEHANMRAVEDFING